MKEKPYSYDWAAYYHAAYEREKKKNMLLAGRIADAEAKENDLLQRLNRIQNSIFWKVSAPARKCYHALKKEEQTVPETEVQHTNTNRAYEEEVYRQKHSYLQWIEQYEDSSSSEQERYMDGWNMVPIEDTDLCIIVCGTGIVDARAGHKIKSWFNNNENYLLAYTDEDYYWKTLSNRMQPWFKPCYSPDTLLSFCYMGHMIITKQSLYNEVLTENSAREWRSYADFYDLCLRLEEKVNGRHGMVSHIEEVLFHNSYEPDASGNVEELLIQELEQGRDMTGCDASYNDLRMEALRRRGIQARLCSAHVPGIYHVVYDNPAKTDTDGGRQDAMVSVVIPSKDHPEVLGRCLSSFREKTDYDNYEWIVVDNGSNAENKSRMEELQKEYGFLYLYEPMEFNFSAMCNLGVSKAAGELILLLNDDVEVIEKNWLRIMAGQAGQPHTGAVGAKLWYAGNGGLQNAGNERIQHTGITNLNIGPSHKLITFPDDRNYYYGHNQVTYNMIGVTAACLMIERCKYREVGGLDETMKVAYNDVDFCFKLIEAGYYNVLRNDAVLYHYESLSRGLDEQDDDKWERLLCEKEKLYQKHPAMESRDDFYHKNLIDNASHYACNFKFDYEKNLKTTEIFVENAGKLAEAETEVLQLTIDRAEKQHKIHREEPDIMWIMGWCYIPGKDNAQYEKKLVLQQEDGTFYTAAVCPWLRKDAAAVLTNEVNILLSGFAVRIKKEKLHFGTWRIGMLATDVETNQSFLTWSDKEMTVI